MEDFISLILLVCALMLMGVLIGICMYTDNCITPMDVYQGKTTLEYTIVDGVKVDSCVIWKKEE